MKKQGDYEKEIIRFCQILTQQKYDKSDDKIFKKLISENLNCIEIDPEIQDANKCSNTVYKNKILRLSSQLVNTEYKSESDVELKEQLRVALKDFSESVERTRQNRPNARIEKEIKKIVSCF